MSILETIERGTLSFQKEKGVYQKFFPNTEAELVTMKNGKDLETLITEIVNTKLNEKSTLDLIYPIGSVYISANDVNPATLFKGTTWEAFGKGKTLVGKNSEGAFATLGETGGATSRSIKVNAHTHTISHTHTIASHSHTIAHTHTVNAHSHSIAHTHGMSHNHTVGNTILSNNQLAVHSHVFRRSDGGAYWDGLGITSAQAGNGQFYSGYTSVEYSGAGRVDVNTAGGNGSHTHTLGTVGLNTGGSSAANSGNASPSTGGSSAANSGGSGTLTSSAASTANSGSAGAQTISVDVTQPYVVVNIWKRTA